MNTFIDPIAKQFYLCLYDYVKLLRSRKQQDERFLNFFARNFHCPNIDAFCPEDFYLVCPFCEHNRYGNKHVHKNHLFAQRSYQTSLAFGYGGVNASKKEYLMKRPEKNTPKKKGEWSCPDKGFEKNYPTIARYLCDGFWEDGKPRELSVLSINFSQGCVSLSLADKDLQQSCYTTAETVQDALGLLEEALAADKVTWRAWKGGKRF